MAIHSEYEKSMQTLELPQILTQLATQAVTEEGKERALALRPMEDMGDVRRALEETDAAVHFLHTKGTPSFSGVRPVADSLMRAHMGGVLNTRELLGIASVLRSTRAAKDYGEGDGEKTVIDHLFRALRPDRPLEERITTAIVDVDEIADAASSELASIRRQMRATGGKIRDNLNRLIASPQAKYLQETLITMRGGRYVVPVKSEHKNEIPGLVHDVSGSGSTFFIEPMAVVKVNNELRELQAKEEAEIERILAEFSADCASIREEILENYKLLIFLDLIFAKGKLSLRMEGKSPTLTETRIYFKQARHPLIDARVAVRNDLSLGDAFDSLIITGPNTGGKTVVLKTLGLLTLMGQCGLHIPVEEGSCLAVCRRVWADIGDEQSIAQSLSTFSSHMTNIVQILKETEGRCLVLFDELGAGTDPVEGAALAVSILEAARAKGALIAATTHYAELKVYAMTTDGVQNASCEFSLDSLAPTYRLLMGIPGKSNAFAISERLGLPRALILRAAERLDAENIRFEDVLSRLDEQRQELEQEKNAANELRRSIERDARVAARAREELEAAKTRAREEAEEEARGIIEAARTATDEVFSRLRDLEKRQRRGEGRDSDNNERANLRGILNEAEGTLHTPKEVEIPPLVRPAEVGDVVRHLQMGVQCTVQAVGKDGSLQLQAGILSLTAKQEDVRFVEAAGHRKKVEEKRVNRELRSLGGSSEIDLRGMTTDEAEGAVERFVDQAMLANLNSVTVIHGKGTGAVRRAVHLCLKRHKAVKNYRLGRYGEGEDGVTVVELK